MLDSFKRACLGFHGRDDAIESAGCELINLLHEGDDKRSVLTRLLGLHGRGPGDLLHKLVKAGWGVFHFKFSVSRFASLTGAHPVAPVNPDGGVMRLAGA